MMCTSVR